MVYVLFLVFDFMRVTASIRSNDNLYRTECARLRRRDDVQFIRLLGEDSEF